MAQKNCNVLCWNVRGLNDRVKRASVRNLIASSGATIVCFQETKIETWSPSLLCETLGPGMMNNYVYLPASGTAGGVLIAAAERFFMVTPLHSSDHTVSAKITTLQDNATWSITGVYGPQSDQDKIAFMQELCDLKQHMEARWLILGDFNLILRAEDKNNQRVDIRMLNRFKTTVDSLQLIPLDLHGRRFTWCSVQQQPTMTRIDHCMASTEWLELFP